MKRPAYTWQFRARFRRHAFGWNSRLAIKRIKEALAEIRRVAKIKPELAAEGAVLFLERVSPALEHTDSSSGALGSIVNHACDELSLLIANADVDDTVRQAWLRRLWKAIQDDGMPYLQELETLWGRLCVHQRIAETWVEEFLPETRRALGPSDSTRGLYHTRFKGSTLCLSAMLAAGRHDELIALVRQSPLRSMLSYRIFAVRALAATGRIDEALAEYHTEKDEYTKESVAYFAEMILLEVGERERAFRSYGYLANRAKTHLATYRALRKKYPEIPLEELLRFCIAQTPGEEGRWVNAALHAKLYDFVLWLSATYPTDPPAIAKALMDMDSGDGNKTVELGFLALRSFIDRRVLREPRESEIQIVLESLQVSATFLKRVDDITAELDRMAVGRGGDQSVRNAIGDHLVLMGADGYNFFK